jgi:soluble lytic murein transglycosylase-like protein
VGNRSDDWRTRWEPDGLGVRGAGEERRHSDDRRGHTRPGRQRRRGDRRRAGMRTLLLTAAALSAPHAVKVRAHNAWGGLTTTPLASVAAGPLPSVSVDINSFDPVEARHAYDDLILEAADKYNLDPRMIKAVMQAESAFNAMAVSPVGALGLMQLMPEVAAALGAEDPLDPRQNIMAGSRHLRQLLNSHRGDVKLALASYNAGPGNVAKYRGIPPFKETRNYVKKVTALLADAKRRGVSTGH